MVMVPPSSLALAAPRGGRPPNARRSRFRGGKLGRGRLALPLVLALWVGALPNAWAIDAMGVPPQAQACQACHGAEGLSTAPDIPNLAGQRQTYLVKQLKAFRAGTRKNELMAAIAGQLSDADIDVLTQHWSSLPAAGSGSTAAAPTPAARVSRVTMPAGFPQGYTVYRRDNNVAGKTLQLSYANAMAAQAARAGAPLPDGSAIVVATHAARLDAAGKPLSDANGHYQAGALQAYSVMASSKGWGDDIPALLRNGNWNYGLFGANGEARIADLQPRCLACHKPKAGDSYVFTLGDLKAAR